MFWFTRGSVSRTGETDFRSGGARKEVAREPQTASTSQRCFSIRISVDHMNSRPPKMEQRLLCSAQKPHGGTPTSNLNVGEGKQTPGDSFQE